jgi:hypothetical protein
MRLQRDARWTRVWSRTLGERPTSAQGVQRPRPTSTYQTPRNAFTPRPSDLRVSPWPCRRRGAPRDGFTLATGHPIPTFPPVAGKAFTFLPFDIFRHSRWNLVPTAPSLCLVAISLGGPPSCQHFVTTPVLRVRIAWAPRPCHTLRPLVARVPWSRLTVAVPNGPVLASRALTALPPPHYASSDAHVSGAWHPSM